MTPRLLTSDDQAIVVFFFRQSMPYKQRLIVSIGLLLTGFLLQGLLFSFSGFLLGLLFIAAGNSLLLVRGYTNSLKFDSFNPAAVWEKVDRAMFRQLREFHDAIKKWDRNSLDITNVSGGFTFFLLLLGIFCLFVASIIFTSFALFIISVDMAFLMLPHWITGIRRITTQEGLLKKLELMEKIVDTSKQALGAHSVEFLMLLQGKDSKKMPQDIKFRVNIVGQVPDFLGLYGQLVMNLVNGTSFPYFYTVVVVKPERAPLLKKLADSAAHDFRELPRKDETPSLLKRLGISLPADEIIYEYKDMDDVAVIVIRQFTTDKSGYHTTESTMQRILEIGVKLAETAASQ